MVEAPFQSGRSTRWTRRRRWVLKSKESIEGVETRYKKEAEYTAAWLLCGAATMHRANSPPQYYVHRMWLVTNSQ